MRELRCVVGPEDAGRSLGDVLTRRLQLSRHRVSSLKFSGGILLDGQNAHTSARVRPGQTVQVLLRDEGAALQAFELPLSVPYRDDDLLVVDKPAPLPAIHSARQDVRTLENAVYAFLGRPADFVYRPVSRLDKGTSGLMPVALNAHMHDRMQRLLHTDGYIREYLAVVEGAPAQDAGEIDAPIGIESGVRRRVCADGKPAVTQYRVLQRGPRSLLRLRLQTGRTHQIRVHLRYLGCPVAGDYLYGAPLEALPGRFALHSAYLCFTHPLTGQTLSMESALPDALKKLL